MAFAEISVPDTSAGSGSSTATFGEVLGQICTVPVSRVDTSSAAEDSGTDVVYREPSSMPRRRLPGEVSGSSGSRSPARASPHRHRASPLSSTRRPSTQGNPRGRSGSRNSSDQVSEKQERPPRGTFSPAGSHQAPASRDRSHYGSPSQQASSLRSSASAPYGHTPTRLDTPVYTPTRVDTAAYTPTRIDTPMRSPSGSRLDSPAWSVVGERWSVSGPPSIRIPEKRAMDPGSLPSPSQGRPRTISPSSR